MGFIRTLGVVACLALAQAQGQVSQVRELRGEGEQGSAFRRLFNAYATPLLSSPKTGAHALIYLFNSTGKRQQSSSFSSRRVLGGQHPARRPWVSSPLAPPRSHRAFAPLCASLHNEPRRKGPSSAARSCGPAVAHAFRRLPMLSPDF